MQSWVITIVGVPREACNRALNWPYMPSAERGGRIGARMGGRSRGCVARCTGFGSRGRGRSCRREQVGRDERVEADDFAGRRRVEYHGHAADLPEEDRDVMRELRVAVKGEIAGFDTFQIDFITC